MTEPNPKDLELLREAFVAIGDRLDPDHADYDPEQAAFSVIDAVRLGKTRNQKEASRRLIIAASAISARMEGVSNTEDVGDLRSRIPVHPKSVSGDRLALILSTFATYALFNVADAMDREVPVPAWTRY